MLSFPKSEEFRELIQLANAKISAGDDVTSRLLIPEDQIGVGTLIQKSVGIACGLPLVEEICRAYDERLRVEADSRVPHGDHRGPILRRRHHPPAADSRPASALLGAERITELLQHLAGIATLTNRFVKRMHGTHAKIYDTARPFPGCAP